MQNGHTQWGNIMTQVCEDVLSLRVQRGISLTGNVTVWHSQLSCSLSKTKYCLHLLTLSVGVKLHNVVKSMQTNTTFDTFFCKVLFFMIWPSPLTVFPIDNYILHNSVLPILWQQFLERPFPVSTWYLQHRLWGVVTQHQSLSSLELLWLNGGKFQHPGS